MWAEVALPLPLDRLFTYKVPEKFLGQVSIGQPVIVPFHRRLLRGVIIHLSGNAPSPEGKIILRDIHGVLNPGQTVPQALLDLTRWMSHQYACCWGESLSVIFSSKTKKTSKIENVAESNNTLIDCQPSLILTAEQNQAFSPIQESIQKNQAKKFLLFGVTASGKTEIYLRAIEAMLQTDQEKQALFLLPEISLCQPFVEILKRRFGEKVGVWHSQVGQKDKRNVMQLLLDGKIQIVMGARSALFAPFSRLGLIMMDEEHDASYKQQEKPRYHSREVALKLAEIHRATVILGSATPSIESFYRARQNEFQLLTLTQRVVSESLPQIHLVDRKSGMRHGSPFSDSLNQRITQSLARREQCILALNRRGFSTYRICTACGFVWKCKNCHLALVHHQTFGSKEKEESLQCHFCFTKMPLPEKCENCQSNELTFGGYGTQKVEQEVKALFPFARVLRLDKDVARKKQAYSDTYRTFKNESADILVGTRMVTQGFDFPRVTLVGIIDADTALYHADFRAAEKTFQWICQASGRAGRSPAGGQVIVQSAVPDHYVLESAGRHDYLSFYEKEIELRRQYFFPPFSKLALFRLESGQSREAVIETGEKLCDELKSLSGGENQNLQILGPGPCPRETLRRKFRWQILVKCPSENWLTRVVKAGGAFVPKRGIKISIDVDPYEMV